ncbi:MAG: hypothetical protein AAB543_02155 [Pseudomonadota bacterium]
MSPSPTPTPPDKGLDIQTWLNQQEPTWTAWSVGVLLGALCVAFGLRGIYAYWRGEAPDKQKGIPTPPMALGLLVFGTWVLWVFGISRLPG